MTLVAECELKCGALLRLYRWGAGVKLEVIDNLNFVKASCDRTALVPKEDRWYEEKDCHVEEFNHLCIFMEYPRNTYEMLKAAAEMVGQMFKKP